MHRPAEKSNSPSSSEDESKITSRKRFHPRQENSLGELTKNFIDYVKESGKATININDLVKKLKVKKRRIYDITNVLEGIGYIKKHAKNEISWVNKEILQNQKEQPKKNALPHKDLIELEEEYNRLDTQINEIKEEFNTISNKKEFNEYGYVTFSDLNDLSSSEKIDLLAIKAPKGTFVDIIDPKEAKEAYQRAKREMETGKLETDELLLDTLKKGHHLFLDSRSGEIVVYRITNEDYSTFNTNTVGNDKFQFSFFGNNNINTISKNDNSN